MMTEFDPEKIQSIFDVNSILADDSSSVNREISSLAQQINESPNVRKIQPLHNLKKLLLILAASGDGEGGHAKFITLIAQEIQIQNRIEGKSRSKKVSKAEKERINDEIAQGLYGNKEMQSMKQSSLTKFLQQIYEQLYSPDPTATTIFQLEQESKQEDQDSEAEKSSTEEEEEDKEEADKEEAGAEATEVEEVETVEQKAERIYNILDLVARVDDKSSTAVVQAKFEALKLLKEMQS
mmetsp:Transcript_7506/g.12677  ORF Transcript_7506/g.12677 Transcript_7506/m.12677 type:complete len:238 (-) Transcript_7506:29-742(-)